MASLTGSFLIARPVLKDPSFAQTVVLILQHTEEGAFGLVVNRPAKAEGLPFRVYVGGPCPSEGLFMLHGHEEWFEEREDREGREITTGIYLGNSSCIDQVTDPTPGQDLRFRMFTGYAGWGPDQLERELAAGAWAVVPATSHLLFEAPVQDLWTTLLPPTIPEPSIN